MRETSKCPVCQKPNDHASGTCREHRSHRCKYQSGNNHCPKMIPNGQVFCNKHNPLRRKNDLHREFLVMT